MQRPSSVLNVFYNATKVEQSYVKPTIAGLYSSRKEYASISLKSTAKASSSGIYHMNKLMSTKLLS